MKSLSLILTLSILFLSIAGFSQPIPGKYISHSSLASITPATDFFYFTLNEDEHGLELWRSDGSTKGTILLLDINPGRASSSPTKFQPLGDLLFFVADDGIHGQELWRSDGTPAGTFMVADILPGPLSSSITFVSSMDNKVIFQVEGFTAEQDPVLWQSDGTIMGTVVVNNPGQLSRSLENSHRIEGQASVIINNKTYFVANGIRRGEELWYREGKRSRLVKDINPGRSKSFIMCLTPLENELYFSASDGIHGSELWKSDGTREGTRMILDIIPGPHSSVPRNITPFKGKVYFSVFARNGVELWTSDGTASGTKKVFPAHQPSVNTSPDLLTSTSMFPGTVD